MRIGKQYAYILGAYDARIVFPCVNKQFKCVENSNFSTIDYFSVKLAPVEKLIQYYISVWKGKSIFRTTRLRHLVLAESTISLW